MPICEQNDFSKKADTPAFFWSNNNTMIKIAYGECTPLLNSQTFQHFFESAGELVRARIGEVSRREHKCYRLMAHLILDALCKRELGISAPDLFVTDRGKPYFQSGAAISISHDGRYVAVAFSTDEEALGVDIQSQPNPVMASRVRRRFLTPPPPYRRGEPELEFLMAHVEEDGVDLTPAHPFGTPSSFLCDFVRAEALMKMSGGGFADFPRLSELCATSETAIIPLGDIAIGIAYPKK